MKIAVSLLLSLLVWSSLQAAPPTPAAGMALGSAIGVNPLSAQVAADFNLDGKADLAVASDSADKVSVLISTGNGNFLPAVDYNVGSRPAAIASGDFNLDGKTDLAVANSGSNTVSILLGNGNGTFQAATTVSGFINPSSLGIADFNKDGKPDLAVVNLGADVITVLSGNGDGTFHASTAIIEGFLRGLDIADFDNDGNMDIVARKFSTEIDVYLGNGNGTFQSPRLFFYGPEYSILAMAVGDLNGDGYADLAVAVRFSTNQDGNLDILLGTGNGTFYRANTYFEFTSYPWAQAVRQIAIGDFNGDGKMDLCLSEHTFDPFIVTMDLKIRYGDGTGNFGLLATLQEASTFDFPLALAPADFDGDGTTDVAAGYSSRIDVWLGSNPDLTLAMTHTPHATQGQTADFMITPRNIGRIATVGPVTVTDTLPAGLQPVSIGGTGWSCILATLSCTFSQVLGPGASYWPITLRVLITTPTAPSSLMNSATVSTAFDSYPANNGVSDSMAILRATTTSLTSSPNPSTVNQSVTLTATVTPTPAGGKVTFYDGTTPIGTVTPSGDRATLTTTLLAGGLRLLTARYQGHPQYGVSTSPILNHTVNSVPAASLPNSPTLFGTGNGPIAIVIADFNGDGKADIATANSTGNSVSVLLGNGDGSFQAAHNTGAGAAPQAIVAADLNADGKTDLVVASSNTLGILLGNGDGTFQPLVSIVAGDRPVSVAVGDFNGDAKIDLAAANQGGVTVLLGNGDGTFQNGLLAVVGEPAGSLAVGDFNADGKDDVVVTTSQNVYTLLGNGDGSFQPRLYLATVGSANSVVVADLNGDSKSDITFTDVSGERVCVLLGNGDGSFQPLTAFATDPDPSRFFAAQMVRIADFNGDGRPDLLVADTDWFIAILLGNGDGTFQPPFGYLAGHGVLALAAADFNGDGRVDVAVTVSNAARVAVFLSGAPDLSIAMSHGPGFSPGRTGLGYAISVRNIAGGDTFGTVSVSDTLPAGLAATAITGIGWSCTLATLTCTRGDALAGGQNYPPIALTVDVTASLPAVVTNRAQVTAYADSNPANNIVDDSTAIRLASSTALASGRNPSTLGESITLTVTVTPPLATGTVTLLDGFTAIGTATLAGGTATFSTRLLPAGLRSLSARYLGDAIYSVSTSPILAQSVRARPTSGFNTSTAFETGSGPLFAEVGDFNADGKSDIITTNFSGNTLTVLPGAGGGFFAAPLNTASGGGPNALAIADFNGDGKPDVAVANYFDNTVSVFTGRNDGTFQNTVSFGTGSFPVSVAAADFNEDGKVDLAVVNRYSNNVGVYIGNGNGTFQAATFYNAGMLPYSVVAGDFNGDGKTDLAIANFNDNNLTVLPGTGTGMFGASINFAAGANPAFLAAADLNGDGRLDLVVSNFGSNNVSVFLATAAGGFQFPVLYPVGINPRWLAVGDFNGDGTSDIVVANHGSNSVSILTGAGNGAFQAAVDYAVSSGPSSVAVGDFDNDGRSDIVVGFDAHSSVQLLIATSARATTLMKLSSSANPSVLGRAVTLTAVVYPPAATGSVTFFDGATPIGSARLTTGGTATLTTKLLQAPVRSLSARYQGDSIYAISTSAALKQTVTPVPSSVFKVNSAENVGLNPIFPAVGDFNRDGKPDIVVANLAGNNVSVLLGNGNGEFQNPAMYVVGTAPKSIAVADLNEDGKADLAVANSGSNTISVLIGNGDGTFQPSIQYGVGSAPVSVIAGDFNGDGKVDLAVGNSNSNDVSVLAGRGNGALSAPVFYPTPARVLQLAAGDFNNDGRTDIVVANDLAGVTLLFANASGGFQPSVSNHAVDAPTSVAVADLNGDGILDLVFASRFTRNLLVQIGNGDGSFGPNTAYFASASGNTFVIAGDLNGDGKLDAAIITPTQGLYQVPGNGDGTFQLPILRFNGPDLYAAATADFDGDGTTDLVAGRNAGNSLAIWLGTKPDFTITKTHAGNFRSGQAGARYSIAVQNAGEGRGFGVVTVTDTLPAGMTASTISGAGWSCALATVTCTRSDTLGPGEAYPAIEVMVNISSSAVGNVTNRATVSGGGDANALNNTATDPTVIQASFAATLTSSPNPSMLSQRVTLSATVNAAGATGKITFFDGTTPLGTATLSGNTASLTTLLAGSGLRSLIARYNGDAVYAPISSPPIPHNVQIAASTGFQPMRFVAAGSGPVFTAVGDLNKDGRPDIATANTYANSVSVAFGKGDGTFSSGVTLAVGLRPDSVAIADFDRDGNPDLVVLNSYWSSVSILRGNGDGTFHEAIDFPTGHFPNAMAIADFNGDGKIDIATANTGDLTVSVVQGNGDGTFQEPADYHSGFGPNWLAIADFNRDGNADVASTNSNGANSVDVGVLLGNGDGSLQSVRNYANGYWPSSIAAGDFNGDGKPDLAVAYYYNGVIAVLLGNGDGTFRRVTDINSGNGLSGIVSADINGDGKADLAIALQGDNKVSVFYGIGDGSFRDGVLYDTAPSPVSVAVADLNGDNVADLVVGHDGGSDLTVLLGKPGRKP